MKKVATMKALWALTSQLDAISYGVDAVSEIHKKEEKFDKKKDRLVTAGIVLFSALAVAQVFNLCCKIAKIGNSNSISSQINQKHLIFSKKCSII